MVCPGLTVPPQSEVAGTDSMWAQGMEELFTDEVVERVKRTYPLRRIRVGAGGRKRGGVPGIRRCQFHHRPDPERFRRLHDDVNKADWSWSQKN